MVFLAHQAYRPSSPFEAIGQGLQLSNQLKRNRLAEMAFQGEQDYRKQSLDLKRQQLQQQALESARKSKIDDATMRVDFMRDLGQQLERVGDDPQAFEQLKGMYQQIGAFDAFGIDPNNVRFEDRAAYKAFAEKEAQFGQPVAGIGPDGNPAFMRFDKEGGMQRVEGFQPLPRTGMEVTTPDGTTVRMGGEPSGSGLAKPTQNKVEEAYLNTTERVSRVGRIRESFKPEYLQIGTRWDALSTAWKEKAGFSASPEDRQALAEFSAFRSRAANDLTQTLKEMSGAAVTPQEAERLLTVIPNPGTGLFDGDSPTQFKAKMDDVYRDVRRAEARLNYIRKNGFDLDRMKQIPLNDVPKLINERAGQLELEMGARGLQGEELEAAVRQRLAEEFGLGQ